MWLEGETNLVTGIKMWDNTQLREQKSGFRNEIRQLFLPEEE